MMRVWCVTFCQVLRLSLSLCIYHANDYICIYMYIYICIYIYIYTYTYIGLHQFELHQLNGRLQHRLQHNYNTIVQ